MGLDVYFCKYKGDRKASRKLEAEYEKRSEAMWEAAYLKEGLKGDDKHSKLSPEGKEAVRKKSLALKEELGLDEYGCAPNEGIEINSSKYPDHMFKIGYFRSSYNGGGFNSVLRNQLGKDLYWIFDQGEEYEFRPDWKKSLGRAKELLAELRSHLEKNGSFKVMPIHCRCAPFGEGVERTDVDAPGREDEALKLFQGQRREEKPKGGVYFDPPLKARAFINGLNLKNGSAVVYVVSQGEGKRPLFDGLKVEPVDLMVKEATIGDGMPLSEVEALKVFVKHRNKHISDDEKLDDKQRSFLGGSYGCGEGEFFFDKDPVVVRALIPGTMFKTPTLYCVYDGEFGWYINALEIVIEACEYMLALPAAERRQVWVHWSA